VYALPSFNPLTVIGEDDPVPVTMAPVDVSVQTTMYEVIAPPPTSVGAVKATETEVTPAVAVPIVGAAGTFSGKYEAVNTAA
jgi:hypothetical protein